MENSLYSTIKILVVDDTAYYRTLLVNFLKVFGFHEHNIIKSSDGKEALGKLSDDIKLVITDASMPGMSGITLVKKMREHNKHKNIPVIGISTDDSYEMFFLEAGANTFLQKQMLFERLEETIKNIFSQQ